LIAMPSLGLDYIVSFVACILRGGVVLGGPGGTAHQFAYGRSVSGGIVDDAQPLRNYIVGRCARPGCIILGQSRIAEGLALVLVVAGAA